LPAILDHSLRLPAPYRNAFPRPTATPSRGNDVLQLGSATDNKSRWREGASLDIEEASRGKLVVHIGDVPHMATTAHHPEGCQRRSNPIRWQGVEAHD
jgi:hypothetical protein